MTSGGDIKILLERALEQTAALIAATRADQAGWPTPCADWDVRALVQHLAGQDLRNFLLRIRGKAADWQAPPDEIGDDWATAFRDRAAPLIGAWRATDLDSMVPLPGGGQGPARGIADQQITELAVHGWDLATATGRQASLDPSLAEHGLSWSRQMLRPEFRGPGKAFGLEVPVGEDAPAYERLAGWFGRDPRWTPSGGPARRQP